MIGTVKAYNPKRGTGILSDGHGNEYYLYQYGLHKGQEVEFEEDAEDDEVAQIVRILQPQKWFRIKRYTLIDNLISAGIALILGAIMAFFLVKNVHAEELSSNDISLIAKLICAEAENQPFDGKKLVASVVLNRLDSDIFPDTIEQIIFQNDQFSVIKNGAWDKAIPIEEDYEVVLQELKHRSNKEILYFTAGNYGKYGEPVFQKGEHFFSK